LPSSVDYTIIGITPLKGGLKLQEWTLHEWTMKEEITGPDIAGVDNDGVILRGLF